jgi:hypothetical protein
MNITREQFYEMFRLAWLAARPGWDVLDTKLAWEIAKQLGLEPEE